MATIAVAGAISAFGFGAVPASAVGGSAFLSGAATFVTQGALIGAAAALDTAVLNNLLFKPERQEGPRIGDVKFQGASQGDPVVRGYGKRVRVPGFVAWASPVYEEKDVEFAGSGKGGSGGEFIVYKAYRDCAVQFINARASGLEGGVSRVVKVFADGKLFWNGEAGVSEVVYTANTIKAIVQTSQLYAQGLANFLVLAEDQLLTDLRKFGTGQDVDVSGFTGAASVNNGTWRVWRAFAVYNKSGKYHDTFCYVYNPDDLEYAFQAASAGDTVTVEQRNNADLLTAQPPEFALGTKEQQRHRLLERWFVDNTGTISDAADLPAMRGRAVMWLDKLLLTDFGNRLPNFEAIVEVDDGGEGTLADAIKRIALASGLSEEQVDVSGLSGSLGGFSSVGPVAPKNDLQAIMLAHSVTARSDGTRIIFEDRDSIPSVTLDVDSGDFGVHVAGRDEPQPFEVTDSEEKRVPRELDVQFTNIDDDNQGGNRRAHIFTGGGAGVQQIDLRGVAMTPDEAQVVGQRTLSQAHAARRKYRGAIHPRWLGTLKAGMRINATNALGRSHDILTKRLEQGANGALRFEGHREDPESLTWLRWTAEDTVLTGATGNAAAAESLVAAPPSALWHAMDLPPLQDEHRNQPGFYMVCASSDTTEKSLGFIVYHSTDGGSSYTRIAELGREAVLGRATTAPSSAGIDEAFIDRATTLRVELHDSAHKLYSRTEDEMLAGHGLAVWGDEIIAFATATLIEEAYHGGKVYDLSVLQRGLRDTGDSMTTHSVGDRFVLLDAQGVHWIPVNTAFLGREHYIKVVANGGTLDAAVGHAVTITGRTVQPFRPAQFTASRNASDDLVISWNRGSRAIVQADHGRPLDEDTEEYRLDIYDGATLVRQVDGITTNTYTYTAAAQTSDGFTVPSDPVTVEVRQRSRHLQWGRARSATF